MKSYRIDQPRPKPPRRTMQDTATPGEIFVHNGCTAILAIPCYYQEVRPPIPARPHDRMLHDMLGWPWPNKPDHSCQEWDFDRHHCRRTPHMKHCPPKCEHFIDMRKLFPIHLREEGYTRCSVNIAEDPDDISAHAEIDDTDDWIIRVEFAPLIADLLTPDDSPATFHYSVFVDNQDDEDSRSDLVALGKLTVLPAPINRTV